MFCNPNVSFPLFLFYGVSFQAEEEEEDDQPLSLSWPDSNRKRLTYLLIIPIVLPLWITLPDVRKTVCMRVVLVRNISHKNSIRYGSISVDFILGLILLYTLISLFTPLARQASKKFFPITFLGAITWIAIFSYLMVWWAHQVRSSPNKAVEMTLQK